MAFRPTIVAFEENGTAYPYIGHQFTEIVLQQPNGEDASNPAGLGYDFRDAITEGVTGGDAQSVRRKVAEIDLAIDYLDTATKQQLERLYNNGRPFYFCPNCGPYTRWSFPLQRSLKDFMGRKTMSNSRSSAIHSWDSVDKVYRSWFTGETMFQVNGRWSRYLATQAGHDNQASNPHPTSTGHGWTAVSGVPTFQYTETILSPVVRQRAVTNQKGVVLVYAPTGGGAVSIQHSTGASLNTSNSVVAAVCVAWQGSLTAYLQPTAGGTVIDIQSGIQGDGTFQLIRLRGPNTDASNDYRVVLSFDEVSSKRQAAILGPTYIANYPTTTTTPSMDDWNTGTTSGDSIAQTDSAEHALVDFTLSWMMKWPEKAAGICDLGSTTMRVYKGEGDILVVDSLEPSSPQNFSNVQATLGATGGWDVGDWVHCVLRGSDTGGLELFINGAAHSENGDRVWAPGDYGHELTIGTGLSLWESGLSHLRMDAVAWTDAEVQDHHDTYFADRGRGIVEPLFGKQLRVAGLDLAPRVGTGDIQWVGQLSLAELAPNEELAGMIRQEGDV